MKRLLALTILCCLTLGALRAQDLSSIRVRWSDSFVEWDLFAYSADSMLVAETLEAGDPYPEDQVGFLKLRWLDLREDWSEWDYEMGSYRGTLKMKWKDDPTHWELRDFNGEQITMRMAWANDPTQWRVTDNNITVLFRSRWTNQADEWQLEDSQYGNFYVFSLYRGDPRDWGVNSTQLDPAISPLMRLAMAFIAIYQSTPKQ